MPYEPAITNYEGAIADLVAMGKRLMQALAFGNLQWGPEVAAFYKEIAEALDVFRLTLRIQQQRTW